MNLYYLCEGIKHKYKCDIRKSLHNTFKAQLRDRFGNFHTIPKGRSKAGYTTKALCLFNTIAIVERDGHKAVEWEGDVCQP